MEWLAFLRLEPRGEPRLDDRFAMLCLVVSRLAGSKRASLDDFRLRYERVDEDEEPRHTEGDGPPAEAVLFHQALLARLAMEPKE